MTGTIGLIVGFAIGAGMLSVLMVVMVRRVRSSNSAELATQRELVTELRQERSEDKETNRRLRHELHTARSLQYEADERYAPEREMDSDTAYLEREDALRRLADTQRRLDSISARLADREKKLHQYRDALKEIRLSLEAQDPMNRLATITEDVAPSPPDSMGSPPVDTVRADTRPVDGRIRPMETNHRSLDGDVRSVEPVAE